MTQPSMLSQWDINYRARVARREEFMKKEDCNSPIIEDLRNAWSVEGNFPEYHQTMKNKLRTEWPTLAEALDKL